MNAFAWLLAIVFGITALVVLVSAAVASARVQKWGMTGACAGFTLALLAVVLLSRSPYIICVISLLLAPLAFYVVKRTTRNAAQAEQVTRLSAAHCALLAGSLLFLIPFAWLISTSLKSDDEQAVFPPVWIPTQQITSEAVKTTDGEPAPISWYLQTSARPQKVAEIAQLPSGAVQVLPIESGPEAKPFEASREQLTKIRHVEPRWKNYSEALEFLPPDTHYGLTFLGNTLYLTLLTVLGTVLSSSLVAYAFARLTWPGKNLLFIVLLSTMMIPGAVTMMPQFLIFRSLGWVDTLRPLWVPAFFGSAFNIFLLRQFFMSIPTELEDAAKIDGCTPFTTYWRIMLPQVKPALAAVSISAVMGAWNNFQGPLIYLSSPDKMTLAYGLQLYQQQHSGDPGLLMAASTLVVLPIIVLFFFTQRYFIEGVSLSGLGGR
ncbi:L-arabinose transport system permease protein AraQ [Abditibacteriota bacterium]|nr:L-arabinose transport system permease protein AraQ [Abditibacteriota bacterium]